MQPYAKLLLSLRTVRHMKPRQWIFRLRHMALKCLPAGRMRPLRGKPAAPLTPRLPAPPDLATADKLLENIFPGVAGDEVFGDLVQWDLPGCDYRLRCFRLNSFFFLPILTDAAATGEGNYVAKGFQLMLDWFSRCSVRSGDKWDPYVTAQRLMNQIFFLSAHPSPEALALCTPYIRAQSRYLSRRIEYHLDANHLLTEANALLHAGAFLQDGRMYRKGKKLLLREARNQFLPDGGHYERSPSYHVEALQQCLEGAILLHRRKDPDFDRLRALLYAPVRFLSALLLPDGQLPPVNDAARDYPFGVHASDLLSAASALFTPPAPLGKEGIYSARIDKNLPDKAEISWNSPLFFQNSGFFLLKHKEHTFFFDAGDHGPDFNLGHAHADSLSLLWTAGETPVFVDCGVYTYQPGPLRDACRATAAHNTVEVDGISSAEIWGAFRTARRGRTIVDKALSGAKGIVVAASHDGYEQLLPDGVTHRRELSLDRIAGTLTITDTLIPHSQRHSGMLRFHLDPDCAARLQDGHTVCLAERWSLHCSAPLRLAPTHVARRFGKPEQSLCVTAAFPIEGETAIVTKIQL